MNKTKEYFYW